MKKLIILFSLFMLLKCKCKDSHLTFGINVVTLSLNSDSKTKHQFDIGIDAKLSIAEFAKENEAAAARMYCPLSSNKFTLEESATEKYSVLGYVSQGYTSTLFVNGKYTMNFPLSFIEREERGTTRFLSNNEILDLIQNTECVNCKISYSYFMFRKPTYSETFCIPSKSLIELLKK